MLSVFENWQGDANGASTYSCAGAMKKIFLASTVVSILVFLLFESSTL